MSDAAYFRQYYHAHLDRERARICDYKKANCKAYYIGYLGPMNCPKCGIKGYGYLRQVTNHKTGVTYAHSFLTVLHHHSEYDKATKRSKTVYDDSCYIGVVN